MVYDLTFDEAMDVLENRIGWVQGENFSKDEFLTIDPTSNRIIRNTVKGNTIGCIQNYCGSQTREIWSDIEHMQEEMRIQKYRFILVLNPDSIRGEGAFSHGECRDRYLWYKQMKKVEKRESKGVDQ